MTQEQAQRKLARQMVATLVYAMAETDIDYVGMAKRLDATTDSIHDLIDQLIGGRGNVTLDQVSDLFFSTGHSLRFNLERMKSDEVKVEALPNDKMGARRAA
jgi:hypothetical protein